MGLYTFNYFKEIYLLVKKFNCLHCFFLLYAAGRQFFDFFIPTSYTLEF